LKSLKPYNKEIIEFVVKKENAVNPFLTIMNFKISYKTWLKHCRITIRKVEKDKLIESGVNPDDLENFDLQV
jgi:hypothetical protein